MPLFFETNSFILIARVHRLEIASCSLHDAGDYTFVPEGYSQSLSAKVHIIGMTILVFLDDTEKALLTHILISADPPRVHLEGLNFPDNTFTIVAGNKLRLEIPISGEPAPRVVWMKGERVSLSLLSRFHNIVRCGSITPV